MPVHCAPHPCTLRGALHEIEKSSGVAIQHVKAVPVAKRRAHFICDAAAKTMVAKRPEEALIVDESLAYGHSLHVVFVAAVIDELGLVAKPRQANVIRDRRMDGQARQ